MKGQKQMDAATAASKAREAERHHNSPWDGRPKLLALPTLKITICFTGAEGNRVNAFPNGNEVYGGVRYTLFAEDKICFRSDNFGEPP